MKIASYDYILKTVHHTNILPVTSTCPMGCVFCSHRNNPSDIDVYRLPYLTFDEIKNIIEFLDSSRKIVIGESASRIIEGEPFARDDIMNIVRYIRKKYPKTDIGITTNGVFLTKEKVKELKVLEPLELNISLNSSTSRGRGFLYYMKDNLSAIDGVKYLNKYGVLFNGSIVAMPGIVGYSDIEETIDFLCTSGAQTVRVFVPGFSELSQYSLDFYSIRQKLHEIGNAMYEKYNVPVLVEPPEIKDLEPDVCGVLKDSPADKSGILKGDIVLKVDNYIPASRVDAYNALFKRKDPKVQLKRGKLITEAEIQKKKNASSGAVFYYDIHPDVPKDILNAVKRNNSKKPLIVTSELALPVIRLGAQKFIGDIDILCVKNKWFGGSIMCTGLLTIGDIIDSVSEWCISNDRPDLIILPSSPFDVTGKDLTGRSYHDIEETLNIKTSITI